MYDDRAPNADYDEDDDHAPLLTPSSPSYGTTPISPGVPRNSRRLIFNAALKMAVIFTVGSLILGGTLWIALPTLEEDDRPRLHIPKSFQQLQDLNFLLKKYRDIFPYRIVVCYIVTYLFLQAFSLPGSMYLSILGGAVWGVARALPLACACVASGGTLCYLLSAALGPALLALPKFQARLDTWTEKIARQRENIIPFLIVLRIAPLPPHWVVNVVCPHVGIGLVPFWISTFLGIFGVTVIHTTIGGGLDQMTSADDFHLISWRNFFLLSAVVVGVLIPVGIRWVFKRQTAEVAEAEAEAEEEEEILESEDAVLARGPRALKNKHARIQLMQNDDDESVLLLEESDAESDEDIILEAGPALVYKAKDGESSGSSAPPSPMEPKAGSSTDDLVPR
ncbi:hypothetical protein EWM64_g7528 [Hericium alpestre]|uniref:VTT domain-containing protein n=1 Tax=Hericium alpestre TaxID=135208 RepID=A0A4Y9ZNN7_9AGAM|nr:hypothetical protein EWM64_g7528 [Hericium alpestre]